MYKLLLFVVTLHAVAFAQMPVPTLPQVYIDTTFNLPTGTTWSAHTATDFTNALTSSNPGDVIVLDAGTTYSGNFTLPAKANPNQQWIYIVSSALGNLRSPGWRVGPSDAPNMPKIVTPNTASAIAAGPGANYYRLVGLEIATASTYGCNLTHRPKLNCWSWNLIYLDAPIGQVLPDSITVDRCYMHGSPTQDVGEGVYGNATKLAVIDSYISDIHLTTNDSQAILSMVTPGPIKIVNNTLSATTENIMIGGGGGPNNPYVPSDVEIRKNWLYKPIVWSSNGVTTPPTPQWSAKNLLEFKSAQRVLVDSNTLENSWASGGQGGTAVLFTVRSSASGNLAVVDDITFTNNVLKNVGAGFATLTSDYNCGTPSYPLCTNPGESKRIRVANNLILFRQPNSVGGVRNTGIAISPGLSDYVLQHNTFVPAPGTDCWNSVYFDVANGTPWPPPQSITHNIWLLDNAFCRQPSGDFGGQGTVGINNYMGDPAPVDPRYLGNVMYVPSDNQVQQWPLHNFATTVPFNYVSQHDHQLVTPNWMDTSDGTEAGVDDSKLPSY
jgi:hypothetical protein